MVTAAPRYPGRRRTPAEARTPGRPAGTPGAGGGRLPPGHGQGPRPDGFGRILRDSAGRFLRIVEERDGTPEEKAIREVNPSCYVFELPLLWEALDQIGTSNAQHEYYLTDAPERLMKMGRKVIALNVLRPDDILGVNTRQHLAQAAAVMQARIQDHWMTEGVTIVDPRNTHIDGRAVIGRDTVIHPFTVISGNVRIGSNCQVGPFTHLRPGTVLEEGVEAGAFVEIKESHLQTGTVARHLAYLGNASVGRDVNIGAGTITANFDGVRKNKTEIGDRAADRLGGRDGRPRLDRPGGHRRRRCRHHQG